MAAHCHPEQLSSITSTDYSSLVTQHVRPAVQFWLWFFVGNFFCSFSIKFILAEYVYFSYPLMSLPLPGTIPTKVILPSINVPETSPTSDPSQHFLFGLDPFIYVQQIILRSVVLPWGKDLQLTDAFRGPLFEVCLDISLNYSKH